MNKNLSTLALFAAAALMAACGGGGTDQDLSQAASVQGTAGSMAKALKATPQATSPTGAAQRYSLTYLVPGPSGGDDTAAIQAGLDWCAARGPGCTVQLQAGKYETSQLVEYDFRGTFRGAGVDKTTLSALPLVPVTWPDVGLEGSCPPNLTDCRWPTLVIFVNGSVTISGIAFDFPYTDGQETSSWQLNGSSVTGYLDALRFMGDRAMSVAVDHVSVTGRPDAAPSPAFGMSENVLQGIYFAGDLPAPPYRCGGCQAYATLSGTFAVRSSTVDRTAYGILTGGINEVETRAVIGGAPGSGNRVTNAAWGAVGIGSESSAYDVSYNTLSSPYNGVLVSPLNRPMTPGTRSTFAIHDNTILTTEPWTSGVFLYPRDPTPWLVARVAGNHFVMDGGDGVDDAGTQGAVYAGNVFTGAGNAAVALWGDSWGVSPTSGALVAGNSVRGLAASAADYFLDSGTTGSRVVCTSSTDTALDFGTGNAVIRCGAPAAGPAVRAPATRVAPSPRARRGW